MNKKKLNTTYLDIAIPQSVENLQLPDASLITYYKNLGIKCPKKKFSVGSRFASLIKSIVVVTCPILHLLFLASFVLAYEEVCQKTVDSYILDHKKDEWELLNEKNNNEC